MTMDPSLPGLLHQAARAVAEVRQAATTTARTAGSAIVPGWHRELTFPGSPDPIVITAVGRTGNEGPPAVLRSE